MSLTGRRM